MDVRVFEAFAGYGSQMMALRRLQNDYPGEVNFMPVGISEIEPNAIAAYGIVHGDVPNYGDISRIDWNAVPDFDLFTYSWPCTDVSTAGRQEGLAKGSGTRSSLLWECERAIAAKRPRWLLMENVKALVSKKFRADFQRWIDLLSGMGYVSHWQVMNAKDYGVPQNRERVFMVSVLKDAGVRTGYDFPKPWKLERRLKDVLEPEVDESYYLKPGQVERIVAHCEKKLSEGCGFRPNFCPPPHSGSTHAITARYGQRETDPYIAYDE